MPSRIVEKSYRSRRSIGEHRPNEGQLIQKKATTKPCLQCEEISPVTMRRMYSCSNLSLTGGVNEIVRYVVHRRANDHATSILRLRLHDIHPTENDSYGEQVVVQPKGAYMSRAMH